VGPAAEATDTLGGEPARLLWLLRHAKAASAPPSGGGDRERLLTARGRRDAEALGRRLGPGGDQLGFDPADLPATVLCSTAARTVQTAERVLATLEPEPTVVHDRTLYGASAEELLEEVRATGGSDRAVMLVGHNPGIAELAVEIAAGGDALDQLVEGGMRTCALAVVSLPVRTWSELAAGCGELVGLFTPPYESRRSRR
jgi:phosphohistidine phosphatase